MPNRPSSPTITVRAAPVVPGRPFPVPAEGVPEIGEVVQILGFAQSAVASEDNPVSMAKAWVDNEPAWAANEPATNMQILQAVVAFHQGETSQLLSVNV